MRLRNYLLIGCLFCSNVFAMDIPQESSREFSPEYVRALQQELAAEKAKNADLFKKIIGYKIKSAADETRLLAFFKEVGSMMQFLNTDNQSPLSIFIDYHIYQIANEAVEVSVEGATEAERVMLKDGMLQKIYESFPEEIKNNPMGTMRTDYNIPDPSKIPWTYEALYNLYTNHGENQAGFTPKTPMTATLELHD